LSPLQGTNLRKHSIVSSGIRRWYCNSCKKTFQQKYRYNAHKPGTKEQIIKLTLNGSGVRDISRVLKINKNTVCSVFKKTPIKVNPSFDFSKTNSLDIELNHSVVSDEFWSYVGNKSNQRWIWYCIERKSGIILAWHNGRRSDSDFLEFYNLLSTFPIRYYYTDFCGSYSRHILADKHIIGKSNTCKIERKNLNFRTYLKRLCRKTICFSKNETIHNNVIGLYIENFYFKNGKYIDNN